MIFKFTIEPCGAIGTPFRSDTLFGHACWAVLLNEGAQRFEEFRSNAASQRPELVFSDGFPSDWLPRPLLPQCRMEIDNTDIYSRMKKIQKQQWIERKKAEDYRWNPIGTNREPCGESAGYSNKPQELAMLRNVIDRMTGTSLAENGLYSQNQMWFDGIWRKLDIYVSTEWDRQTLSVFLERMFAIGYGRDQTIGLGKVNIIEKPAAITFPATGSNWHMSLSHMVPDDTISLSRSFYQLEVKYGRVWAGLEQKNPFKKRILQTIPGSVFCLKVNSERAGMVLADVHDNGMVVENCMAVLYPLPATAIPQGVA